MCIYQLERDAVQKPNGRLAGSQYSLAVDDGIGDFFREMNL